MTPFVRDGVALAVHEGGEGRPWLFQHGLGGDAAQVAELAPDGVRTVTVECRGHGASDAGPEAALSLAAFADDLAAAIGDRLPRPLAVGGISMGAALALRLAVRRPDLVAALVLVRPAWLCDPAPPNLAPYAAVGDLLARRPAEVARAIFDASATARHLAEEAPDNLASLRGLLDREPRATTAALLSRIARDGPGVSKAEVAALRVPALVIGHAEDAAHPLATAEALSALIPGTRLVRVTPKGRDRALWRAEIRAALGAFLRGLP